MLRTANRSDVPAMLAIYAPYVLTSTATFEYDPPSEAEFYRRYDEFTAQFPWLLWEEDGEVLGYAYGCPGGSRAAYSWCVEPVIYLRPEAHGKGIARKLYAALEAILREQGYQVLYSHICDENKASLRFHEKAGYHFRAEIPNCGFKFGRWMGLIWMEKRLSDVKTPNGFPVPWLSIVQNAETLTHFLDDLSLS